MTRSSLLLCSVDHWSRKFPALRAVQLDKFGRALRDGRGGEGELAAHDGRHHGGVRHAQPGHTRHAQVLVNHLQAGAQLSGNR